MNEQIIVDVLYRTNEALYKKIGGSDYASAIKKSGARVLKYRRYERGDHDANLTVQQRRLLNIVEDEAELNEACSNYCSIVIDMMAGRVGISEVNTDDEEANDWINDTLTRNSFEAVQGEWFRGAIRDRESFVTVDPQTALWISEPAYDGYSGVVAIYDNITGLPIWACKLWAETEPADVSGDAEDIGNEDTVYLVVYQPNQITYWKASSGSSEVDPVMVDEGSLPMLESGNGYVWQLGLVPMVQFANKRDNYTAYGESEIRVVIPLQDIVNATLYDMMMASKLSAFKIYYSIGMKIEKDAIVPGSVINLILKDKDGHIITNIDENLARFLSSVKVGEFGTTDMSQYTNQLDKLEREISQVSATPVYGITAQNALSGEALKQLEIGLINKVIRFQKENSGAVRMLFKLTALIQRTFNVNATFEQRFPESIADFLDVSSPPVPPAELDNINISWRSPEIINVAEQVNALSTMRRDNPNLWPDEWYREKIGALLGMSSQQIVEESEKADVERVSAFDQLVGGRSGTVPLA